MLEHELRVAEVVENFRARAVEQLVFFRRINRHPIRVALLLKEEPQQSGIRNLARLAACIILTRDAKEFLGLVQFLGLQGRPAAACRQGRLCRRIDRLRERFFPKRERFGKMILPVGPLGQDLRRVPGEFSRRLLVREGLQQRDAVGFFLGGQQCAAEKIFRRLLQRAVALVDDVLQGGDRIGKFLFVEKDRAAPQLGVGAERAIGIVLDLVGVGGQRVVGTFQAPVRFRQAIERFFAMTILREISDELRERRDRIGVLAGVEKCHRGFEPCRRRSRDDDRAGRIGDSRRGVRIGAGSGHGLGDRRLIDRLRDGRYRGSRRRRGDRDVGCLRGQRRCERDEACQEENWKRQFHGNCKESGGKGTVARRSTATGKHYCASSLFGRFVAKAMLVSLAARQVSSTFTTYLYCTFSAPRRTTAWSG